MFVLTILWWLQEGSGVTLTTMELDAQVFGGFDGYRGSAICNAACETLWNCTAWTLRKTKCTLRSNVNYDDNGAAHTVHTATGL